ncbi:MAG: SulP family inorganic anion transporter [Bacteroidota bacterium]
MKNTSSTYDFKNYFQGDLSASLVVFLVAIPLCLGIALASGVPLMSGIIAGLCGGIIVGIFGGSPLGVSGPAAGLVAVVLAGIAAVGSFQAFLLVTVLAGLIQLIFAAMRAGIVAYYVPNSVIKGMLAAIGVIIILKEIPYALGASPSAADAPPVMADILDGVNMGVIAITVVSLAIIIVWNLPFTKRYRFFKIASAPLMVVVTGIVMQTLFEASGSTLSIGAENLVHIEIASNPADYLILPDFEAISDSNVWIYAVILAAVASIEALLCAEATDKLDPEKRITPMNKELFGQGMGNIISGMLGGLPITQVIVRSSANIQSGGKTRMSAVLHGLMILISILIFPSLLNMIPLASLAVILLMVGWKLTKPAIYMEMFKNSWGQFVPFLSTVIAILATDLLIGIGIGFGVAVFFILRNNYKIPFTYSYEEKDGKVHVRMHLSEIVSFLNKGQILATLQTIPEGTVVEIDARKARVVDQDVVEVLKDFIENAKHRDIEVVVEEDEFHFEWEPKENAAKELRERLSKVIPRTLLPGKTEPVQSSPT